MKPQGTATYKLQFHPHHQGTAGRQGKGGEGFSHGCDWHLGEAEAGMALRGVFLARKNAFLVEKKFFLCVFSFWRKILVLMNLQRPREPS